MKRKLILLLVLFLVSSCSLNSSILAAELTCNVSYDDETSGTCPSKCPKKAYDMGTNTFICALDEFGSQTKTIDSKGIINNPVLDPTVGAGEGNVILAKLLAAIINLFFIAGSVAVLVFFLIGGLAWITSEGDKGKMELAKNRLTYAGIGIVIIAATYAILQILGLFLGISFFKGLIITWPTLTGP